MAALAGNQGRLLATVLCTVAFAYLAWKITQSPEQALQFTFNGLSVGAVYALLAIGFTLVYSTVWFFDLYYGAAAALGAYGVFYLRSQEAVGGQYAVNSLAVNIIFGALVAGVVAWALYEGVRPRLRDHCPPRLLRGLGGALAAAAGVYTGLILAHPDQLHVMLAPAIGLLTAGAVGWVIYRVSRRVARRIDPGADPRGLAIAGIGPAAVLGGYCGMLLAGAPGSQLYLSWAVSCLLAATLGLALYRGLYVYMRERARTPLVMLVATLGVLLALTAFTTIVFHSAPRPLPDAFGSDPWTIGGANVKGFNVFTIGVAIAGFLGLLLLLKRTAFGKAVRAIGDDEEVAKVVGINTTAVIAVVFFIAALYAALGGVLSGHDTAIQPRMGLLLLLKGWIASVVGGIGNLWGAIVGGFVLGLIEQFGIWDLAGEWRDAISFVLLVLFLSFWPKGLLPRR
jgi:branched-chain amino acid transport system permease protein